MEPRVRQSLTTGLRTRGREQVPKEFGRILPRERGKVLGSKYQLFMYNKNNSKTHHKVNSVCISELWIMELLLIFTFLFFIFPFFAQVLVAAGGILVALCGIP